MLQALKPLIDSGIVNEDTKQAIAEAWEAKLAETREEVRAELREEFARRYEHDKSVMVEALDKMVTEGLAKELEEFAEDKRKLAEDRVAFKKHAAETGRKFNQFLTTKLAEEIQELRADRKTHMETISKLEKFVIGTLAEEIKEFAQDKKDLAETKVRLITLAKTRMDEMQKAFVQRGAKVIKESVANNLKAELTQFKKDIQTARENMFGRRIFETFAAEFAATHLNENAEIRKLQNQLGQAAAIIKESKKEAAQKTQLVESKNAQLQQLQASLSRDKTMQELLGTLTKEKAKVMSELLESVQTSKLKSAFDKYLPAVLNNGNRPVVTQEKQLLSENRIEVTGDKTATLVSDAQDNNVFEIKRLAGLKVN
jgi:hypothetical protein